MEPRGRENRLPAIISGGLLDILMLKFRQYVLLKEATRKPTQQELLAAQNQNTEILSKIASEITQQFQASDPKFVMSADDLLRWIQFGQVPVPDTGPEQTATPQELQQRTIKELPPDELRAAERRGGKIWGTKPAS